MDDLMVLGCGLFEVATFPRDGRVVERNKAGRPIHCQVRDLVLAFPPRHRTYSENNVYRNKIIFTNRSGRGIECEFVLGK